MYVHVLTELKREGLQCVTDRDSEACGSSKELVVFEDTMFIKERRRPLLEKSWNV